MATKHDDVFLKHKWFFLSGHLTSEYNIVDIIIIIPVFSPLNLAITKLLFLQQHLNEYDVRLKKIREIDK